jgi:glucosamine--fructose-6-phosphate aminotransferase (isomerizing)
LIEHFYEGDLLEAVRKTVEKIDGSYAFLAINSENPDEIIAVRKDSPLVVGVGEDEYFLASDIPALLKYTKRIMILEDDEIAVINRNSIKVLDKQESHIDKEIKEIDWDLEAAEKGGFPHFMIKEIFEQPEAVRKTLRGRIEKDSVKRL